MQIGYVNVHVRDLERAVEFYQKSLGLELKFADKDHGYASFAAGPISLGLAVVGPAQAGAQSQTRDRGDRGQRLSPEAEAADSQQVVGRGQLARRVALQAQVGVPWRHSGPVVAHRDQADSAVADRHADPLLAGLVGDVVELALRIR